MGSSWGLARDSEHHTHASQQGPGYTALPCIPISLGLNIPQKKGELTYSGREVGRGWRQPPDIGLCLWGPTPATCPACHLGLICYCFFAWMGLSDLPGSQGDAWPHRRPISGDAGKFLPLSLAQGPMSGQPIGDLVYDSQ